MKACSACGRENADDARFCSACGVALGEPERQRTEVRKVVTVVFSDVTGSTALGERLDPESLRRVMSRYFDVMSAALGRHGATVEKFIGDAIMAVFGIPRVHEDDALRAVRATAEMREELARLNEELERDYGVRLENRTGINTGEVVAGDPSAGQRLVTGDAVNVAARLEQAAAPGQTLLGESTYRLVRDAVEAEPVEPLSVKGKTDELAPRLLVGIVAGAEPFARRLESRLVGREREQDLLRQAYRRAVDERSCHLFTILGVAGIGKSRLAQEFLAGLGAEANVVSGRCLSYGEGITYWPLVEILEQLGNEERLVQLLEGEPEARAIVNTVLNAIGQAEGGASPEEIPWAVRKLLEALARGQPLVVVLDDLQWAEPTFLDLVEHVADLARDAPILLLCMARPELLDGRPGWAGGKLNASSILLEPLAPAESRELVGNLVDELTPDASARISAACEGHPLFAEELIAMLIDEGLLRPEDGRWGLVGVEGPLPVPPTIQALLGARVDRLPDDERALLTRVSVEGNVFHREAMRELAPPALAALVERSLASLVRRDVIRPDRSSFPDDDAFRFRHILIRDAAYRSLPKETRAQLHERFADWLEGVGPERLHEFEEIVGYHLEQAHRFQVELGDGGAGATALAARASERLESAARRALRRSDYAAAAALLERAAGLSADNPARRAALLPELGEALIEVGRLADADVVLAEAMLVAEVAGDECASGRALVQQQFLGLRRGASAANTEASAVVERVIPVFRAAGDEAGLCSALNLRGFERWMVGQTEAAAAAWDEAAEHARSGGLEHERTDLLCWIASSLFFGPTPVPAAIERCSAIRGELESNLLATADVLQPLAGLHAMEGRFDEARALLATSRSTFEEFGLTLSTAVSHHAVIVELLAGDPVAAERSLREGYAALEQMGERAVLSGTAAFLGQALLAQGSDEEAAHFADLSAELSPDHDLLTQAMWRGVRASTLARRGALAEAEVLAREAVAVAERTDFTNQVAEAHVVLADALARRGDSAGAHAELTRALELYERKGNLVASAQVRAQLAPSVRV